VEREVLFTGIGGQGIQLAAQVLARAAIAEGREAMLFGCYGGTMRNGPSDCTLVVSDARIAAPPVVSHAWSAIAMHPAGWAAVEEVLEPNGVVVMNQPLCANRIAGDRWRVYGLDAAGRASQCGSSLAGALVLVAAYAGLTGIVSLASLVAGLAASLPERRRQHREHSERALHAGFTALPSGAAPAWPGEQVSRSEPKASEVHQVGAA
jgi:2-oxoglutarate ferredoxin oxidoreductase subunit gamma